MANAIPMIRRCARYGTPEGWQEPVPIEHYGESTTVFNEEPMGNGEKMPESERVVSP